MRDEHGISAAAVADGYDAWAAGYDADMQQYGYRIPTLMADAVERYLPRRRARLLDVGAGTGLVGLALRKRGYRNLVGIDASLAMLRHARSKSVYRQLLRGTLEAPAVFPDHFFDGLLAGGIFKLGHAPPESLAALVRVVRPGGIIILNLESGAAGAAYERAGQAMARNRRWRRLASTPAFAPLPLAAPTPQTVIHVFQTQASGGQDRESAFSFNSRKQRPWPL
jgi:predicted TPR repeat methyltransferase